MKDKREESNYEKKKKDKLDGKETRKYESKSNEDGRT